MAKDAEKEEKKGKGKDKEEVEVEEEGEEGGAGKKAKKKKMMIIIIAVSSLVLLGAIGGGVAYFMKPHKGDKKEAKADKKKAAAEADAENKDSADNADNADNADANAEGDGDGDKKEKPKPANYVPLEPPFVVNFEGVGPAKFLQIAVEVMTRKPEAAEHIKKHMPVIRNNLVLLFGSQTYDKVNTLKGKEDLRAAALAEVQKILEEETGDPTIEALYFTSFVMQ